VKVEGGLDGARGTKRRSDSNRSTLPSASRRQRLRVKPVINAESSASAETQARTDLVQSHPTPPTTPKKPATQRVLVLLRHRLHLQAQTPHQLHLNTHQMVYHAITDPTPPVPCSHLGVPLLPTPATAPNSQPALLQHPSLTFKNPEA
jgi:hypothetical protein